MTMEFLDTAKARAAKHPLRLLLPEGDDPRVLEAAAIIASEGFAQPIVMGVGDLPDDVSGIAPDAAILDRVKQEILRRRPKTTAQEITERLRDPMTLAAGLVAAGFADAMVAGAATPSRDVIRAGLFAIGLAPKVSIASSYFMILLPGHAPLFFADCALNIEPDAEQLSDIGIETCLSARALTGAPARTAFLSYSTRLSGQGESVEKVRAATELAQQKRPDLILDGPLQADAALSRVIAATKGATGPVAGQANVLIFPSLDAGNIGYKLLQELAGAQAIGPFLQGLAKPLCDLSRGATVSDIVAASVVACSAISDDCN